MTLREDSNQYCFLWMGILFLSAYYFNILYAGINWANIFASPLLVACPIILVFFFTGYMKPDRGKIKSTMLAIAVFIALFYTMAAFQYHDMSIDASVFTASWGIGSAILTAGGFSMLAPVEEMTSPGMLDVSKLHYGPKVEEEIIKEVSEVESTPVAPEEPSSENSTD